MKKRIFSTLVFALFFFAQSHLGAATVTILMQGSAFVPSTQTINVGDTVTWINRDAVIQHTATSGANGISDGAWSSPFLNQNESYSHTFDAAGVFPFFCIPHSAFMRGTITVQGAAAEPPVVNITSPANNAVISAPGDVTIQATATVNGSTIATVEFFDNGSSLGTDSSEPYSVTVPLAAGSHSLTAKATAGNHLSTTSAAINVTVQAPVTVTVAITAPANNAVISAPGPVTITADASASSGTVDMVEFFEGTTFLDMAHGSPFTVTPNLAAGSHSLTAKATSSSGATATSQPITITVNQAGVKITDPLPPVVKTDTTVDLQSILDGLVSPLGMAVPDDDSGRMFVYDQIGLIYVIQDGTKNATPLLDVQSRLVQLNPAYDERGLLGVAVHPSFTQNPLVYTYTSEPTSGDADFPIVPADATKDHQSVIAEWRIDPANTNRLDPSTRREIMRIDEPQSNHNAGNMHFGPDGFLYVSFGDGGAADDQGTGHSAGGNGQNKDVILGKVIRIDVNARTSPNGQYGVPLDNPFVGKDGLDEIYAYGFRNPYAWSFDKMTGELYLADVGQNDVEELDRVFNGGNYGWHIKEGSFYFDPNGTGNGFVTTIPVTDVPADLIDPIAQYDHQDGLAIVGGYVYYGTALPSLVGRYITGDLGTFSAPAGRLFELVGSEFKEIRLGVDGHSLNLWIKGFGQGADGEVYLFASGKLGPSGTDGKMFKLVPVAASIQITSITRNDTNVVVSWSGGVGPYIVEAKGELDDPAWRTVGATATTSLTLPISGDDLFLRVADMAGNGATPFTVAMSGDAERPNKVTTPGSGSGTLVLEGNTLHFDIRYTGLLSSAILAHIHTNGNAQVAGPVGVNLAPFNGGIFSTQGMLAGSVTISPQVKAEILAGKAYVNVHTTNNPGGEIRGQIAPVLFTANLSGDNERPEIETDGRGSATFMLVGNQLTFNMEYSNLSSVANNAHIHGPADLDTPAGVMVPLNSFNGGAFGTNGTFSGTVTLTADQVAALVDGRTYVNIHTTKNGGGEIRGQIFPKVNGIPFTSALSGAAERPTPITTTQGVGSGTFALEGSTLTFNITYSGLTGPAILAHIHGPATAAVPATVLINLAPYNGGAFNTNGTLSGKVTLTDLQRSYLLQGLLYVNIHTAQNTGGEIRGQIAPVLFQADLSGAAERPDAIQTAGKGHGSFLLVGDKLTVAASYSNLSSNAKLAHIHGAAPTSGFTGVMVDLVPLNGGAFGTSGTFSGTVTLPPDRIAALVDELTYMNVHTDTHGGGEIRGQLIH
jgi:glucose/arabinose dehydrogenase/plastocyanin